MEQIELNFEAGIRDQFPEFHQCLKASVYSCGKPFKVVASEIDMSSSRLSRMLNENDENVHFPAYRLGELIAATGDLRPIYWLVENFCQDKEQQQKQALSRLAQMVPQIEALLKNVGE